MPPSRRAAKPTSGDRPKSNSPPPPARNSTNPPARAPSRGTSPSPPPRAVPAGSPPPRAPPRAKAKRSGSPNRSAGRRPRAPSAGRRPRAPSTKRQGFSPPPLSSGTVSDESPVDGPGPLLPGIVLDVEEQKPLLPPVLQREKGTGSELGKLTLKDVLQAVGPGLLVCLADSESGGLITAAQSGAQYGYSMLAMYMGLVVVLFMAQELTCRLGIATGKGLSELAWIRYGPAAGYATCGLCVTSCAIGIVGQLRGINGVANLWGVPDEVSSLGIVAVLVAMVSTGRYNAVETVAFCLGAVEVVFVVCCVMAKPTGEDLAEGLSDGVWPFSRHTGDRDYFMLFAANFGTIITPWMLYYQQSAIKMHSVLARVSSPILTPMSPGHTAAKLRLARLDTAVGSCVTQLVMSCTLMCYAATIWKSTPADHTGYHTGVDMSDQGVSGTVVPLGHFFGDTVAKVLFSCGLLGASTLACVVMCLASAWAIEDLRDAVEVHGTPVTVGLRFPITTSLSPVGSLMRLQEGLDGSGTGAFPPRVTLSMAVVLLVCSVVSWHVDFVQVQISINIFYAVSCPPCLLLLVLLSTDPGIVLSHHARLRGWYKYLVTTTFLVASILSFATSYAVFL